MKTIVICLDKLAFESIIYEKINNMKEYLSEVKLIMIIETYDTFLH